MAQVWFTKDPNAILDYKIDWSTWLSTDTISAVVWTVPAGITKDSQSNTTTTATIWLSGGTALAEYELVCHITTTAGRQDDRTIGIRVEQQ